MEGSLDHSLDDLKNWGSLKLEIILVVDKIIVGYLEQGRISYIYLLRFLLAMGKCITTSVHR